MNRPYSPYSRTSATSGSSRTAGPRRTTGRRPAGGFTDVETDAVGGGRGYGRAPRYRPNLDDRPSAYDGFDVGADPVVEDYDDYQDYGDRHTVDDDYDDAEDDVYEYHDEIDRRWIWVAGVAGAILLVAVICTVVILGGGDSGSVSKTISPPIPTTGQPATATAPPSMTSAPPPVAPPAPLSPETVTTVAPSPTASVAPLPVQVAPAANTITYQVTGSRPLIDLVTVVYTDQQGALQTEFNVALPWSRTVTLDPGVALTSVTATSLTGQLNCAITDAAGATIVAQTNNTMIANCTK